MDILKKHPNIAKQFDEMYKNRLNEILAEMLENDEKYKVLCEKRKKASIALKQAVKATETDKLFEYYSDASLAHDSYELDAVYRKGVEDAVSIFSQNGVI